MAHRVAPPPALPAGLLLLAAGGGMQFFLSPLWAAVTLAGAALAAAGWLLRDDPRRALALFAYYWPPLWLGLTVTNNGWWDNRNVAAVWCVAAILALLPEKSRCAWLGVAANFVLLLWLGSRGAMIGLWSGLLVMTWRWPAARRWLLAGLLLVPLLIWWRPDTALYRLDYWRGGLAAWWSAPWGGLGYGGVQAGCWIPEPGGGCQIHAHNLFIHILAEFGLAGLLLAGLLLAAALARPQPRWSLALTAALLAHSMVDMPLFWPGGAALALVIVLPQFRPPPDNRLSRAKANPSLNSTG